MKNIFGYVKQVFLIFTFQIFLISSISSHCTAKTTQTLCRFGDKKIRIEHSRLSRHINLRIKEPAQKLENFFTNRPGEHDNETLLVTPEQNQFVFFYEDSLQFLKLDGHKASWTSHEKTVQANCVKI